MPSGWLKRIKMRSFFEDLDKYLFIIVVIAAILRFSYITSVPPALNWDEVSHGYNAYSILTTGRDEWGVSFPTIFRAFGDYKLPVYIYLTAASEKLFGLNAFAVRLPSVLAGIGTVIFTYLLVLELYKKRLIANLSALLVAVEPWSLFLSRGAFEANVALFFIVSGVYFFLKSVQSIKYLALSTALLGLSVWTYNSARVFVPVFMMVLILTYWKEVVIAFMKNKKTFAFCLLIFAFFFLSMFFQLLQPIGQARYGKISIIDEGAIAQINRDRGLSRLPPIANRLVNNKVVYFTKVFVKNWASHYSSSFLFANGGSNYQFSVPGRGIVYWLDVAPMIVGLLWLVLNKSKANTLVIAWFFFSPIPSALTNEAPQVLRAIVMLPVPMIIIAIGVWQTAEFLAGKKLKITVGQTVAIYIILLYMFFENYGTVYATIYRTNYSWSWQYGYEQIVDYASAYYNDYDKIIVTKKYGEPHEFFLFFWPWSPEKYRNDPDLIRYGQSGWFWVDRFDKFYFVNDWQIPLGKAIFILESKKETVDCSQKALRCLLITSPGNYPKNWHKLDTVNFLDGKPAFEIYDNLK